MRRAYNVNERNNRSQQSFTRRRKMKAKLTLMVAAAMACASIQLTAMPTEEETRKAEPVVKKMLAQERAALESGKKTRSEVAAAAMRLASETDTDAAKLLLMKGAFVLYVHDGNLEKAAETMKALKAAIPDIPQQNVSNMIEAAFLEASKKEDVAQLDKLLGEAKVAGRAETTTEKAKRDLARLYPGWTLASEVPHSVTKIGAPFERAVLTFSLRKAKCVPA